ncbi:MAG: S9 family peptidase [Acidobacteriota bacterium]|nr:S9 family peptidase [Acidobacteriota bacterium]
MTRIHPICRVLCLTMLVAFLLGPALSAAAETPRRPMTADDALNMVDVGLGLISPDGTWVLYSESVLDWEKNKRETKIYRVPASGGKPIQYIGKDGGDSFRFSPDGQYLAFKRAVDKISQIFLMPTAGGEAVQLTEQKTSIGLFKWAPDSKKIYFIAPEARDKDEEKEYKAGDDAFFVDEGPHGQEEGQWRNLWVMDLETRKGMKITDENILIGDFDVSPDGGRILFTARFTNRRNDGGKNEIFLYDLAAKTRTQLTENEAPESALAWAPDGKTFAFLASDLEVWLNRDSKIYLMDPNTKEARLLSADFEGAVRGIEWTPDGRGILFNAQVRTNTNLYRLDVETGAVEALTSVEGSLSGVSFSADKSKAAYLFSDFRTPQDVYVTAIDRFEPVRLTDANPWVARDLLLADMKVVSWKSKRDMEIEGLLHTPPAKAIAGRLPLILNIHGGPAGVFTNSFRASYHIYAGLGYASLSPNVRGSTGYGDDLREGNTVGKDDAIGLGDYEDLMTGVDHILSLGIADPDKLAVRGWSYGGILGGWTITRTDRFKAASLGAGVYDWSSEYGIGFNHDVRLWHIGGTPWDNSEDYRNLSAYTHVTNITTPTILFHGRNDTTCTEAQSMLFFTALKDIDKAPVRYLRVPRAGHGFREPRHQRRRDIEEIAWMQKHVLGKDWKPWDRPKEKKDEDES